MSRQPARQHALPALALLAVASLCDVRDARSASDGSLTLGVFAARPRAESAARWQPLADYLTRSLGGKTVRLEALGYDEARAALESNRLDFVLANPAYFVHLRHRREISGALATVVDLEDGRPVESFGGVIFTRHDRADIATLGDLKGRHIAFIDTDSLGGYQAQAYELLGAGVRLPGDARLRSTGLPQDQAVLEVLQGRADAGFVRTGIIESMAREGRLDQSLLKVLNRQDAPDFPHALSTRLYPQWPFFALAHVDERDARLVSAALLSLEHGGEVAQACAIHGFDIPTDYAEVENLLRALRLPPFDAPPAFTASDIWRRFSGVIVALGAAGSVIVLLALLLAVGNRRLAEARRRSERGEKSAREGEELYRTLVENIDHGIALVDTQFRVLMANAAHARLLKEPTGSLAGRPCYAAIHGRAAICPDCPGAVALATGRKTTAERTALRPDGNTLSVRIQAFPVPGLDGRPRAFIELVEDTTEARRADVERRRLEERILQAQKMESLGILAGGIAHDFNNLLMGILGNTDLALAKTAPESPVRPFLRSVDRAAQRAADLTNQMLAYSGKGRFVVEPINLSRIVEEIGHLLATVVSKRATVRYRLAPELPPVEADATQMRQVVMNLITNASDALGQGEGVITVSTGVVELDAAYLGSLLLSESLPAGRYVSLEVSDTGGGMDNETQARIFDPFFTTKHTGRGLGLAAVLGIVRGHRGAIKVYSEPGRGSNFKILLPALPDAAAVPAAAAEARPAPAKCVPGGRGTVLVVDDEVSVRETTRAMLEDQGFAVLTAADGQEGVDVFRARHADLAAVLLDMTMPRLGGEEAFREMRGIDGGVPVILSSGFDEQDAVSRFTGTGLAGFIQKPYRMQALMDKLRGVLAART